MKYTKIWCYGDKNGRNGEDDFVVSYEAENGMVIDKNFFPQDYIVEGRRFGTLKEAKRYCEGK